VQSSQGIYDYTNAAHNFNHSEQAVEIKKDGHGQQGAAAKKSGEPDNKFFFAGIHGRRPPAADNDYIVITCLSTHGGSLFPGACFPAFAQFDTPHFTQGAISILRGRAHIMEGAEGTFIEIERPGATRKVVGFIPFGDEPTFPQLSNAEGHTIVIAGVVGLDGGAMITMTDTNQLTVQD